MNIDKSEDENIYVFFSIICHNLQRIVYFSLTLLYHVCQIMCIQNRENCPNRPKIVPT